MRLMRFVTAVTAGALTACGGAGQDRSSVPAAATVNPPEPQLLAYATATDVQILGPKGAAVLARLAPEVTLEPLIWSGDGRQVAWREHFTDPDGSGIRLRMADVRTGEVRSWRDVYGMLAPSPTGVTETSYESRFTEYLPSGHTIAYGVELPVPAEQRKEYADGDQPDTQVALAIPRGGEWFVAARNLAQPFQDGQVQLAAFGYRVGSAAAQAPPQEHVQGAVLSSPVRIDDGRVAWVRQDGDNECFTGNEPSGLGLRVPRLPASIGTVWEVRQLVPGRGTLNAIARRLKLADGGGACASYDLRDHAAFAWLRMANGRWVTVRRGVSDVAVAEDGRVATVEGSAADRSDAPAIGLALPMRYGKAEVVDARGGRRALPRGTRAVAFSPGTVMSFRRAAGRGPAVNLETPIGASGFGPLRLGATVDELRSATSTPLVVSDGPGACRTLRVVDLGLDDRLGFRGLIVGERLVRITFTTRDKKPEEPDEYEIGDLQPGVSKIEPRGPKTVGGFRAGGWLNELVVREGYPDTRRTRSRQGAVDYVYRRRGATMVAHSDAAAIVRRIDLQLDGRPPSCRP